MKLEDIMSKNLVVMDKDSLVTEVGKTMYKYDIGFIPISKKNKIIGVITDRDIATKIIGNDDLKIESYITKDLIKINIDSTLEETISLMGKKKVKRLLVKQDNKLVGIVSFSDLLNTDISDELILKNLRTIYEINRNTDTYITKIDEFILWYNVYMKLKKDFYKNSCLYVAPNLLGKMLVRKYPDGKIKRYKITETEAYKGEEDTACHARFGKTKRNEIMYNEGGFTYIYLCYGIHYLLNIVTGKANYPEAVLIRGIEQYDGPGKLTKALDITKELNNIDLSISDELWIEDSEEVEYITTPRIGIDYADDYYKNINWRFLIK